MSHLVLSFTDLLKFFIVVLCIFSIDNKKAIDKRKVIVSLIIYCGFAMLTYASQNMEPIGNFISIILYCTKYIISFLVLFNRINLKIIYITLLFDFSIAFFVALFSNLTTMFLGIDQATIRICVHTIFLVIVLITTRNIPCHIKTMLKTIPLHIYVLLLFAVICLGSLTTFNSIQTSNSILKQIVIDIIIALFTITIFSIIISLFINVISKQQLSNTTTMLRNQVEIQIRHYDKLEKLNNEMRSFRHDYTNHLHSLLSLIKMGEYDDAEAYIGKLLKTKQKSQTVFNTGNRLADAILTDKSDTLAERIRIDYQGIIPPIIDNLDLCVILTNSLDNAIEACNQLTSPCTISISAQQRQGYFVLSIKNPTSDCGVYTNIPATTKSDSENHGLGLLNIQDIVNKYDGQMKIHYENNVFELSLVLKL